MKNLLVITVVILITAYSTSGEAHNYGASDTHLKGATSFSNRAATVIEP